MEDDFDIEFFTKNLSKSNPELTEGIEEIEGIEGTSNDFDLDEFERNLVLNCPELVEKICELDEKIVEKTKAERVSKKQQVRDRHARLEAMMTEGRTMTEKADSTYHEKILEIKGPMELIANAVKTGKRLEIRVRSAIRMDRIFVGIPTTFDEHFNIFIRDATETVLRGRKSQKEIGQRNKIQEFLPEFMRWKSGGKWPTPIGSNRLLEYRFHRTCFVKGDSVILIRALS
uniref:Sm domain-containing protein n=1 Tax=Caenorhabditis tropicalis TaxID=1561998 RepID=A0A1I7TXK1_9PELO